MTTGMREPEHKFVDMIRLQDIRVMSFMAVGLRELALRFTCAESGLIEHRR
jgi:hypothetical protein